MNKHSNLGKKYDPQMSLYPLTLEQALHKALNVPLKKVLEMEKAEKEERVEIAEK